MFCDTITVHACMHGSPKIQMYQSIVKLYMYFDLSIDEALIKHAHCDLWVRASTLVSLSIYCTVCLLSNSITYECNAYCFVDIQRWSQDTENAEVPVSSEVAGARDD